MRTNQIVKASLFTLILALMAIGTIAIAEVMKKEKPVKEELEVATQTWYFTGTDPMNPSHYTTNVQSCGGLPETICSIEAENNGGVPLLNQARIDDIQEVLDAIEQEQALEPNNTVKSFRSL